MAWCAENVKISVKNRVLLDIPHLRLPEGRISAVIGPNGAGKSTLLGVLTGRFPHIAVTCRGVGVQKLTAAGKIALISQHEQFELPITVLDYVLLGRFPHLSWFSRPNEADIVKADKLLDYFELSALRNKRIQTLSGGEKQRSAVVRALLQETEYLLLDEPSNHLDVRHQHRLLDYLVALKRCPTIVMVLHDLNLASCYADDVVLLHHGRMIAQGLPEEVMTDERLSEVYEWPIYSLYGNDRRIYAPARSAEIMVNDRQ